GRERSGRLVRGESDPREQSQDQDQHEQPARGPVHRGLLALARAVSLEGFRSRGGCSTSACCGSAIPTLGSFTSPARAPVGAMYGPPPRFLPRGSLPPSRRQALIFPKEIPPAVETALQAEGCRMAASGVVQGVRRNGS